MSARLIAACVMVAMILAGPLQPLALAQEAGKSDVYDAGAMAITVIGMPLKAVICAAGGVAGLGLLLVTFGSAHRASTHVVEEGCGQKWIVTGDDIRPDPPGTRAFEWENRNAAR
jgi:hypothetical protein